MSMQVEVPPELIPKKFPHYMGRGEMFSYRSTSVLGEIFDKADQLKLEGSSIQGEICLFNLCASLLRILSFLAKCVCTKI